MTEAQERRHWTPPTGPLGELTARSGVRARESTLARGELEVIVAELAAAPSFTAALHGDRLAVIAEVKRRSPSKGALNETLVVADRARLYADAGATALSILTESSRFGGSLSDLREAHAAVGGAAVPLLRKDFITDRVQLLEARAYGASAALLIARALPPERLAALAADAVTLGLTPLIEVRDAAELAEALAVRNAVIGVSNRNLETLVIEPDVAARLIPQVPRDRVVIYESGVTTVEDAQRAAALGADAMLVGSALSVVADPAALVRGLAAIARRTRAAR